MVPQVSCPASLWNPRNVTADQPLCFIATQYRPKGWALRWDSGSRSHVKIKDRILRNNFWNEPGTFTRGREGLPGLLSDDWNPDGSTVPCSGGSLLPTAISPMGSAMRPSRSSDPMGDQEIGCVFAPAGATWPSMGGRSRAVSRQDLGRAGLVQSCRRRAATVGARRRKMPANAAWAQVAQRRTDGALHAVP